MTVTGKIQKFRMREQMMLELGLSVQKTLDCGFRLQRM